VKVLLVYNCVAAHKRAKKILPEVEALFDEKGIQFELRITDYPEHAVDIVGDADFSRYEDGPETWMSEYSTRTDRIIISSTF